MKAIKQNGLVILFVLLLISSSIAIYSHRRRQRIDAEIALVDEILAKQIGIEGTDIKSLIQGSSTANGFDALPVAQSIYKAKGWLNDDEEAIYKAFQGRNKAQVAAIYNAFVGHYGMDLDEYLKSFLDLESEYSKVIRIIQQAA